MKIIAFGCTGFVGRPLLAALLTEGHSITCVVRRAGSAPTGCAEVAWDADWKSDLASCDALLNLAGESIAGGRWSAARKKQLSASRLLTTHAILTALQSASKRPGIWLNASAVGYYGANPSGLVSEQAAAGSDFLAELCVAWEAEVLAAEALGVTPVALRFGVVLGKGGGALGKMLPAFQWGVGGVLGNGKQPMPWVHLQDAVGAVIFAMHAHMAGPWNVVAPGLVDNRTFTKALANAVGKPAFLPVPALALRLLLGEMSVLLLGGQKATPNRLLGTGFRFRFPELNSALQDLLGKPLQS